MARQPGKKSIESRLTGVERGIKSLQASDAAIIKSMRSGFSQMESRFGKMESRFGKMEGRLGNVESRFVNIDSRLGNMESRFVNIDSRLGNMESRFVNMESRLDQIYNHIDGFMKLHETLDIEFRVMKEQVRRLEMRVEQLEANGRS
ncbi:MAG: hypothetical protein HYS67_00465 [Deltaproteobacteria bacterium]|nr:hypothetical protein [Deltaproteobacteria bacterium]